MDGFDQHVWRRIFILATKAGRYGFEDFDFSHDRVVRSVHETLRRLRLGYLDIVELHDIEYQGGRHLEAALTEGLDALEELKTRGIVRFVGVTTYPLDVMRQVLQRRRVDTVLIHNHYSLNDTTLVGMMPVVRERGVGLLSASPLSSGLLTASGPAGWHPATPIQRALFQEGAARCRRRGSSIEQLAIQFAVGNDEIPTTLVSSARSANLTRDVEWANDPPDPDLVAGVRSILKPVLDLTWDYDAPPVGVSGPQPTEG